MNTNKTQSPNREKKNCFANSQNKISQDKNDIQPITRPAV